MRKCTKSNIKQIRLAQFSTNPDIVRVVITFEEDFDTSKIHITDLFLSESDLSLDYSKTARQNKGLHKNVILF